MLRQQRAAALSELESSSHAVENAETSLLDIARKTVAARYAVALLSARFGHDSSVGSNSPTPSGIRMSPRPFGGSGGGQVLTVPGSATSGQTHDTLAAAAHAATVGAAGGSRSPRPGAGTGAESISERGSLQPSESKRRLTAGGGVGIRPEFTASSSGPTAGLGASAHLVNEENQIAQEFLKRFQEFHAKEFGLAGADRVSSSPRARSAVTKVNEALLSLEAGLSSSAGLLAADSLDDDDSDRPRNKNLMPINELIAIQDGSCDSGSSIVAPTVVRTVVNRRSTPSMGTTVKAEALGQGSLGTDTADVVAGFVRSARRQRQAEQLLQQTNADLARMSRREKQAQAMTRLLSSAKQTLDERQNFALL